MKKLPRVETTCLYCGKTRLVLQSYLDRGYGKYCNFSCHGKAMYERNKDKFVYDRNGKNHPMYGKQHSKESREKMSRARMGRFKGENSASWKGNDILYGSLHDWIENQLGRPMRCELCGTTDYPKYEWANRSRTYKRDLSDWIRLCIPCHRRADYHQTPL